MRPLIRQRPPKGFPRIEYTPFSLYRILNIRERSAPASTGRRRRRCSLDLTRWGPTTVKAAVYRQSDDMPDQAGRTVLVTGANSGLGLRTAEGLARRGAKVLMGCHNAEKAAVACE